jgi:hypothetical protein
MGIPKILLLILVGFLAYFAWKMVQKKLAANQPPADLRAPAAEATAKAKAADDLVKCPRCGTYIAAGAAHECAGKAG